MTRPGGNGSTPAWLSTSISPPTGTTKGKIPARTPAKISATIPATTVVIDPSKMRLEMYFCLLIVPSVLHLLVFV